MVFEANRSLNNREQIINDVSQSENINFEINRLLEVIFKQI